MKVNVFALLMLLSFCCCAQKKGITIINGGKTDYKIIIPLHPSAVETFAAKELQSYISKISGTTLPVLPDNTPVKTNEICVGNTNRSKNISIGGLNPDGLIIKTDGQRLVLTGGSRKGVLYSVYDFLETYTGCKRYAKDAMYIPSLKTISIPALINRKEEPAFDFRAPFFYFSDSLVTAFGNWQKVNYFFEDRGSIAHTFEVLLPPDVYFKSHPEYYALMNGTRKPTQPCLSNPEVFNIMLANLKKEMLAKPNMKNWSVSQNDNPDFCQCSLCAPKYARENGSYMGALLPVVNRIASLFPDKTISTLAYHQSILPPKTLKPNKNVEIMFCTTEVDRGEPISSSTTASAQQLKSTLAQWKKLTSNIFIWDYTINYYNTLSPFPNLHTLQPNILFFKQNNVSKLFEQGVSDQKGDFSELRAYLLSKLMWNPNINVRQITDEFLSGFYGPAKGEIAAYLQLLESEYKKNRKPLLSWDSPAVFTDSYLSQQNIERYKAIFSRAEKLTVNTPYYARVVRERLAVDYIDLELTRTNPAKNAMASQGMAVNGNLKSRLQKFVTECNQLGISWLANGQKSPADFAKSFDHQ
ncbi:DUF4838 domain-containing protein [Chitinophaga varians]|uniref:DUF4838 domain-containing protein n=1 Tax=Chitinophaga varians TaxID=2202339 RepID=UPI00165ED392|nr:DUF4838 domain-containing protein [Chitinophaga varians]MBC9911049.1 DUF4838 domain-containing protein [Chitinophaga varians]